MTVKAAMAAARAEVDARWHAKYPDGMWYYIEWPDNNRNPVSFGMFRARPTSWTHPYRWQVGGGYVGRGFSRNIKVHKTFDKYEKFSAFLQSKGLKVPDQWVPRGEEEIGVG